MGTALGIRQDRYLLSQHFVIHKGTVVNHIDYFSAEAILSPPIVHVYIADEINRNIAKQTLKPIHNFLLIKCLMHVLSIFHGVFS